MDDGDHRQLAFGIQRQKQPALHIMTVAFPGDAFDGRRHGKAGVLMSEIVPDGRRCPLRFRAARVKLSCTVAAHATGQASETPASSPRIVSSPCQEIRGLRTAASRPPWIEVDQSASQMRSIAARNGSLSQSQATLRAEPDIPGVRLDAVASSHRKRVNVPARRAEIAHDAADEGDRLAVARDNRIGDLVARIRRIEDHFRRAVRIETIELRHPPIVVAVAVRGRADEARAVRQPSNS